MNCPGRSLRFCCHRVHRQKNGCFRPGQASASALAIGRDQQTPERPQRRCAGPRRWWSTWPAAHQSPLRHRAHQRSRRSRARPGPRGSRGNLHGRRSRSACVTILPRSTAPEVSSPPVIASGRPPARATHGSAAPLIQLLAEERGRGSDCIHGPRYGPDLELAAIADRVLASGGPGLVFENVIGSSMPVAREPAGHRGTRGVEHGPGATPSSSKSLESRLALHLQQPRPPKGLGETRAVRPGVLGSGESQTGSGQLLPHCGPCRCLKRTRWT